MGILLNEEPRDFCVTNTSILVKKVKDLAKDNNITIDQAIKIYELGLKEQSNSLYVYNGNIKDEQFAGFGKLLKKLIDIINRLCEDLEYSKNS